MRAACRNSGRAREPIRRSSSGRSGCPPRRRDEGVRHAVVRSRLEEAVMKTRSRIACAICLAGFGLVAAAQEPPAVPRKGGEDISGPYEVVPNWPQPFSKDLTWGRTSSIFAESPDRVFVLQSGMIPAAWR